MRQHLLPLSPSLSFFPPPPPSPLLLPILPPLCFSLPSYADAPEITPANSTTIVHDVPLGSELRLSCGYVGVPSADLVWIQNSTMSLMAGSGGVTILGGAPGDTTFTIVISSVVPDSKGTYTCNATNTVGSDAATYTVRILSKLTSGCTFRTLALSLRISHANFVPCDSFCAIL